MILKPLHENRVNKKVARLNALWVFVFCLIFIFIPSARWIIYVMLGNFFIKAFVGPWYSPISQINRLILVALNIKPEMIFAPPKIFAARVGFTFSFVGLLFYLLELQLAAIIIISVLALFAFIEFAFDYCMGCTTYSYINKIFKSR